jgi:hypothetical protein
MQFKAPSPPDGTRQVTHGATAYTWLHGVHPALIGVDSSRVAASY